MKVGNGIVKKMLFAAFFLFILPVSFFLLADFQDDEVVVAVLDTGVDLNHPMLKGKVINGYDFASWDTDASDPNGHGTHVSGIIAGEAPDAKILSVRVINEQDEVKHTSLAILYAIIRGADVINMSFIEPRHFLTEWSIALGRMKGVLFVASSGNQGKQEVSYPSKYDGVYSIAGFDPKRDAVIGNVSEKVRFIAPGVNIRSASPDGGYDIKSGTSMSAGVVSGAIALLLCQYPDLQEHELEHMLEWNAVEVVASVQSGDSHVFHMVDPKGLLTTSSIFPTGSITSSVRMTETQRGAF